MTATAHALPISGVVIAKDEADRIGRDGVIHANEKALLKFLSDESPDIHPSLRTLLDTAA